MELNGSITAATNAEKILSAFRRKHQAILHIQHISTRPGAKFFIPETDGVNIHPLVTPIEGECVITKNYPNSFRNTSLLDELRKINPNRLFIVGMMTHMCIDATVRAAFDFGFECIVAHDACATKDLVFNGQTIQSAQVHASFISALNGMFAEVLDTDSICSTI